MASNNQRMNTPPGPSTASAQDAANQALLARLDPSHPRYIGPGYTGGIGPDGKATLLLVNPQVQEEWRAAQARTQGAGGTGQPAVPTLDDLDRAVNGTPQPQRPLMTQGQAFGLLGNQGGFSDLRGASSAVVSPASRAAVQAQTAPLVPARSAGAPGGAQPTSANPEAVGPAEVDRAKIDELLGNVSRATSGIMGLAGTQAQFSEAQAQLQEGLAQSQAQALSTARSGNRRDAASLGARALQTGSELAGQATRSAAILRAQEETQERQLRLDAFKAAGDLGLNAGALEIDMNRLNMTAATEYLNQLFATNRLNLQLDEAEAQRVTNFIRDMALIEKDYHALTLQEQAAIRDDLTRRHGINANTALGFAQLEAQGEVNWAQMGANFLMGVGSGAASAGMTALLSDRRTKTDIREGAPEEELEELLSVARPHVYRYTGERGKAGDNLGIMGQDLRRTRLGRSMVDSTSDGTLIVDGGKLAGAAFAAASAIHDKLKALEARI